VKYVLDRLTPKKNVRRAIDETVIGTGSDICAPQGYEEALGLFFAAAAARIFRLISSLL